MQHAGFIACLVAFFIKFVAAEDQSVGATVQTQSGLVTGHAARNRTAVSEYLGIPYAQPPLGNLRFAAPQSFHSSNPFSASAYVRLQKIACILQ